MFICGKTGLSNSMLNEGLDLIGSGSKFIYRKSSQGIYCYNIVIQKKILVRFFDYNEIRVSNVVVNNFFYVEDADNDSFIRITVSSPKISFAMSAFASRLKKSVKNILTD